MKSIDSSSPGTDNLNLSTRLSKNGKLWMMLPNKIFKESMTKVQLLILWIVLQVQRRKNNKKRKLLNLLHQLKLRNKKKLPSRDHQVQKSRYSLKVQLKNHLLNSLLILLRKERTANLQERNRHQRKGNHLLPN